MPCICLVHHQTSLVWRVRRSSAACIAMIVGRVPGHYYGTFIRTIVNRRDSLETCRNYDTSHYLCFLLIYGEIRIFIVTYVLYSRLSFQRFQRFRKVSHLRHEHLGNLIIAIGAFGKSTIHT